MVSRRLSDIQSSYREKDVIHRERKTKPKSANRLRVQLFEINFLSSFAHFSQTFDRYTSLPRIHNPPPSSQPSGSVSLLLMESISIANTVTQGREVRTFAHILLFRCPQCKGPVTAACSSKDMDREQVAARVFKQPCKCGWLGNLSGLTAVQHWVECWWQPASIEKLSETKPG